jgi:hypothetical protein
MYNKCYLLQRKETILLHVAKWEPWGTGSLAIELVDTLCYRRWFSDANWLHREDTFWLPIPYAKFCTVTGFHLDVLCHATENNLKGKTRKHEFRGLQHPIQEL